MSTPYSDVYNLFLEKVSDYQLSSMTDADLTSQMSKFLHSAVPRFHHNKVDLSLDDVGLQFVNTLSNEEQEIIASLMLVEWVRPKVNNTLILNTTMTDKDFQMYSQANQLKALRDLKNDLVAEANRLIRDYTYGNTSDLGGLVSGVPTEGNSTIASEIPTSSNAPVIG